MQSKRLVTTSGLGTPYYCVTPAFVQAYVGDLEGAVVFLGTCYSGKDDTLANAFLDKGAAAVLGYTDEVYIPYEMLTRSFFFEAFSQGDVTVSQAVDYAKTLVGPELMEGLPRRQRRHPPAPGGGHRLEGRLPGLYPKRPPGHRQQQRHRAADGAGPVLPL